MLLLLELVEQLIIQNGSSTLRLNTLQYSKNYTLLSFYPACNADNKVGNDKWANCILNSNFKEQIKIYNDMFYNHTIPSLNKIDKESKKSIDIEALKEKFTSFTNKSLQFSNSFFNNNNTNTPSDMFGEFRKNVIEPLQNEISNLGNTKNKILISINDDIQKHKDEVTSLERQKDNIATRLNSTQFVIGTLPLTLTQTIAGFPVALAIGFLICVTLLTSTIKLFGELRKDGHKKIALIAPLWIYPTGIRLNIIARFLVFSTPFILFIIAWCLIGYSFTLCPHNKDLLNIFGVHSECLNSYTDSFRIADFRIWIYTILYVVSFGTFITGLLIIASKVSKLRGSIRKLRSNRLIWYIKRAYVF